MKADEGYQINNAGIHPYHHFHPKVREGNFILQFIASIYIFLTFTLALSPHIALAEESNIEVLENQLQQQPENVEILLKLGIEYRMSKRYQDALNLLTRAKEIDPNSWAVRSEWRCSGRC